MTSENAYAGRKVYEISKNSLLKEGAAHYRAKQYEKAVEAYEMAIQLDPGDVATYVGKGDSLRHLKRYIEALDAYEKAIDLDDDNVSAYTGKCYTLIRLELIE